MSEKMTRMNASKSRRLGWGTIVLAAGLLIASACASKSGTASSGTTVKISAPTDGGTVTEPFNLTLDSSVPLGDPTTGQHHVHLCFDGASCDSVYQLAYSNSVQVTSLSPGKHTITASLRNADHSSAGATTTITVTVGGAGGSPSPTPTRGGY